MDDKGVSGDEFEDATGDQEPELKSVVSQESKVQTKKKNKKKKKKKKGSTVDKPGDATGDERTGERTGDEKTGDERTGDERTDDGEGDDNGVTLTFDISDVVEDQNEETEADAVLPGGMPGVSELPKQMANSANSPAKSKSVNLNSGAPLLPDRKPVKDWLAISDFDANNMKTIDKPEMEVLNKIHSSYDEKSHNYLLQARYLQMNDKFDSKDTKSKASISSGLENVKKMFNDIKSTVGSVDHMFEYEIDWDFWNKVVNNYEDVVKHDSDRLNDAIMKGIPKEFRGIIWELISKSKNFELEEFFYQLKSEPSMHEKSIRRDLVRTSFYTNVEQVNKGEELFNVIKAYSIFDPDVGYTQGMIFITVPLIMNMTDSECFGLLVSLMKDYQLRELFSPEMKGLHLLLYKFDRLLESYSPILYNHLLKQGIKSSMYASQWFLTFFAYKFPLDMVLRIYDIIITQGIESIMKFGINLMLQNESNLMALNFDKLLDFLKNKLFNVYVNEDFINYKNDDVLKRRGSKSKRFSLLGSKPSPNNDYYKLDELVYDSMQINIDPVALKKFDNEFQSIYDNELAKLHEIEKVKQENGNLRHQIKNLEMQLGNLNSEHIGIVQQLVDHKFALPEVQNEMVDLNDQINHLKQEIEEIEGKADSAESVKSDSSNPIPSKIQNDIQELLEVNAKETERFAELEDELQRLIEEENKLTNELASKKSWFKWKK